VITSSAIRVLPVQLQIGDRLTDETGEYEVIGRPYDERREGRSRARQASRAEVTMIRTWSAHERIAVDSGKEDG
jgi:hypothetical protein